MATDTHSTPEERAAKRVEEYTAMLWHLAAYVIVNVFLWIIVPEAAIWVTIGWGIGLAFHAAQYFIGNDGKENRRYQRYLAEERAREEARAPADPEATSG